MPGGRRGRWPIRRWSTSSTTSSVEDEPRDAGAAGAPRRRGRGRRGCPHSRPARWSATGCWRDRGAGPRGLAPREGIPSRHFAYFVSPEIRGQTPVYQLFIKPGRLDRLWEHARPAACPATASGTNPFACEVNPTAGTRGCPPCSSPGARCTTCACATRAASSERLQRRRRGSPMKWPASFAPTARAPSPLRVFSWSIRFPRYDRFDGKRSLQPQQADAVLPRVQHAGRRRAVRAGRRPGRPLPVRARTTSTAPTTTTCCASSTWTTTSSAGVRHGHPGRPVQGGRRTLGRGALRLLRHAARWRPYCGYTLDQRYEASYCAMPRTRTGRAAAARCAS